MEAIDFISIATIAFLGSFGHCVGMCGGIVIAYSSTKVQQGWSKTQCNLLSHLTCTLWEELLTYTILRCYYLVTCWWCSYFLIILQLVEYYWLVTGSADGY